MNLTKEQKEMLRVDRFPLSSKYDPQWVLENKMGPNPLWLVEWLCEAMDLKPGMRILDMGCGTGITSIFLAKEFGVQVWATDKDFWPSINDTWRKIRDAGVENRVFPIRGEAHSLPYPHEFFDAMVSLDAYHDWGTSDTYFAWTYVPYAKPGSQIGIVVPGLMQELDGRAPAHLYPWWGSGCYSFHTANWWRWHWEKTERVDIEVADTLPDGWQYWQLFEEISRASGIGVISSEEDHVIGVDKGRYLGFIRVVARKR